MPGRYKYLLLLPGRMREACGAQCGARTRHVYYLIRCPKAKNKRKQRLRAGTSARRTRQIGAFNSQIHATLLTPAKTEKQFGALPRARPQTVRGENGGTEKVFKSKVLFGSAPASAD